SDGTLRLIGLLWALLDGTGPLLLEEPELSLHPDVVRYIPLMMWRVKKPQNKAARQVFLSTHSSELLSDEGINSDELLLLIPSPAGSIVKSGGEIAEVRLLLETGLPPGEVVIPYTQAENINQLSSWGN
ncbi:MAG: ATP-binding protein, partial [Chloroflexi bacterium]|nr:ATP-binding protein [Chloroflexota bacterium]